LQCQLDIHAKKGLIGMFVYLDCMQYRWKNCDVN
jgi:hypothetical protein